MIIELGLIAYAIKKYLDSKNELSNSEKEIERKRDELLKVVDSESQKFNAEVNRTNYELDFIKMNTQFQALKVAMSNSYNYQQNIKKQEKALRVHKDSLKKEMDRLFPSKDKSDHEKIGEYKEARNKIIETLKDHEKNLRDSVEFLANCKKEKLKIAEYIRDNCGKGGKIWFEKNFKNKLE